MYRKCGHKYMGIMVGIGTLLADDPMLNARIWRERNPVRIICDSMLRIPLDSNICQTAGKYRTIIAYAGIQGNAIYLEKQNAVLKSLESSSQSSFGNKGKTDLIQLMKILGEIGIDSIFIEGGGTLNYDAFAIGIVNEVKIFIAPKIIGGKEALTPVEGAGGRLWS